MYQTQIDVCHIDVSNIATVARFILKSFQDQLFIYGETYSYIFTTG